MADDFPPRNSDHVELRDFTIHPPSVRCLPERWCRRHHLVVLGELSREGEGPVTVALLDPQDQVLLAEAARLLGRPVQPVRLSPGEIRRAQRLGFGDAEASGIGQRLRLKPPAGLSFEADAPVARLLEEILGEAIRQGASDVHIESYEDDVDVRLRIDGVLEQLNTALSRDNVREAVSRLKVLASLDIAERHVAQDGRINAVFEEAQRRRNIDFRVSVVPGPHGEDAVLRILDSHKPLLGLTQLGLADDLRLTFERLTDNPEGLLLVTGPTGSGKTTTLYAALNRVNTPENKILTAEDPIEYFFSKTNQKQVSEKMGFAAYARAFLRQNPDIILIGEIRDEPTADVAIRAAQTGHLVLSTVHTPDAVRTVGRMRMLGIEPSTLAGCLLGALSQRLLRRLCPGCREPAEPSPAERERLGLAPADRGFWTARGCKACDGWGFRGRVGIYELFVIDERLGQHIADDLPAHELRRAARAAGMKSLLDDALDKARQGLVPLGEILRAVPYRMIAAERS